MFTNLQRNNFKNVGYIAAGLAVAISVYLASDVVNVTTSKSSFCDVTNQTCTFVFDGQTVSVYFQKPPQIEEQSILHIKGIDPDSIEGVSIQGVNMYMGTIPVVNASINENGWKGWTFLGACSEPEMVWQLTLHINEENMQSAHHFNFTTSVL